MATDTFDPWHLTSGLIDDVDVTIKDAFFAFDPQYMNGERMVLKLEVVTDDDDTPEDTLMYPCGTGWEPKDKGARAAREDGKTKSFNKSTGYGLLITSAIEAGAGDVLRERGGDAGPLSAAIWKGLTFHMERRTINYGGDIGDVERLLPTEYKGGMDVGDSGGKTSGSSSSSSSSSGSSAPADSNGSGTITGKHRVDLIKLAKASDTHDAFMEAAYELDWVSDGDEAAAAQALVDTPEGIYAEARG